MRRAMWLFVFSFLLSSRSSMAQGPRQQLTLDSGAVVRLRWNKQKPIKATLLAPLAASSDTVRFCRYPSSACGERSINPAQSRLRKDLEAVELRRPGRLGRGMLLGAGIGVIVGGFAAAMATGLSDTRVSTGRQFVVVGVGIASLAGVGALLDLTGERWVPQ